MAEPKTHASDLEFQRPVTAGVPLLRWTYGLVNRIVTAGDVVFIFLSSGLLFASYASASAPLSIDQAFLLAALEAAVFVRVLQSIGAYRVENYAQFWAPLRAMALGLIASWVVGSAFFVSFRPSVPVDLGILARFHLPQLVFLVLARQGARLLWSTVRDRALVRRDVVLIGTNPIGEAVLERLLSPAERMNFQVVGVFADASDDRQDGTMLGMPVIGDIDRLGAYAQNHVIDLVVVALPMPRAAQTVAMIEHLKWIAADVVIPVEEIGLRPTFARLANVAGVATLQVLHRPLKGSQAVIKIIEDYVVASVGVMLVAPLMLLVALAIRLDSKGPVFFVQSRTGFGNNAFRIYKFRTMTVDPTDDGSVGTTVRDDPRITRVGRILRRLSIDELPQLFNVLRGEMSMVGPRPYVPNMLVGNDTFRRVVHNYAFRYRLKPGITGLAQVSGLRSHALRSLANAQRSIDLDLHYIANWSLWLDFKIMVRTVLVAMTGREVF